MKKHECVNKPSAGDGMTEKVNRAVLRKRKENKRSKKK